MPRIDRKLAILAAAIVLLFGIYLLPEPAPLERAGNLVALTANGKACLAIMAFAVTLWVTETIPFAATSLLVVLLIPAFGIAGYRDVVRAGFGDPVITFFIGVLMLSTAFTVSGLGARLTYVVLQKVGTRTDRVLLGVLIVGTLISMWITDIAVAAMLLPLGVGLLHDAGLPWRKQFRALADDRHRIRPSHRRHRDAGRYRRQPRRDRTAQAARPRGYLIWTMDDAWRPGIVGDGSVFVVDSPVAFSAGDRATADQHGDDSQPPA